MKVLEIAFRDLNSEIRTCRRCRLVNSRINALCGEGNLHAELMLIAQAPGGNEDREGKMFIGPSGKVLDELLAEFDIQRAEIYITNLIKCMLPKNRKPKTDEIAACSPYLEREIDLLGPRILAPLGYYASRFVLEKYGVQIPAKADFRNVYGQVLKIGDQEIIPLQHPAAVLHDASIKEAMVTNYRRLRLHYDGLRDKTLAPMGPDISR